MSVCECGWGGDEILGACVLGGGPRIARKILDRNRSVCPNCNTTVKVGSRCVDHAGIHEDTGWFSRFHYECFTLMELFADRMCGGEWSYPFDLVEAAGHAVSQGDDPYWRRWLDLYEKTWEWTPEPEDPPPNPYRWQWLKVWAEPFIPGEGKVVARFEKGRRQGE